MFTYVSPCILTSDKKRIKQMRTNLSGAEYLQIIVKLRDENGGKMPSVEQFALAAKGRNWTPKTFRDKSAIVGAETAAPTVKASKAA